MLGVSQLYCFQTSPKGEVHQSNAKKLTAFLSPVQVYPEECYVEVHEDMNQTLPPNEPRRVMIETRVQTDLYHAENEMLW